MEIVNFVAAAMDPSVSEEKLAEYLAELANATEEDASIASKALEEYRIGFLDKIQSF